MTHEATSPESAHPPTLEGNIALWEQRVDRLAAEAPAIAGSNQYPEWYYQDNERLREIVPQLKAEGADLSNVSKYYKLSTKEAELWSTITGFPQGNQPIKQIAFNLGEDLVGKALMAEPADGIIRSAMIDDLSQAIEHTTGVLSPELNILKAAYGTETATELLGIGGDEYSNKLRSLLLNDSAIGGMRFADKGQSEWHENQEASRVWMSTAVEAATGMPADEASDYVFTASRCDYNSDTNIISIIKKFDHFGVDRIRELAKTTGIHSLEAYSVEQIERMEEFVHDPTKVAKRLANHDVIAVMVNRAGDHNGVMRDVASDFDDDKKRVLFFEINRMDDIYRRVVALRKAGIQPSTIVLAAHSAPGQFMVSDRREKSAQRRDFATVAGRKLVAMVNSNGDLEPGDFGYSMHGMKGMARLVETYMQPSRAIDDNDADVGREKIIFQACHAATEVNSDDIDENGEEIQTGMQSVVSQLGNDLIASGVKTSIDIYGAPGSIQLHRNDRGVHYSGQKTSYDQIIGGRPHLSAMRIRVENGQLDKQEVHDIALRK